MKHVADIIRTLSAGGMSIEDIADIFDRMDASAPSPPPSPAFVRAKQNDDAVHVYVMRALNGHVKIGISQHPKWRAKALSAEWRGPLEIKWVSVARSRRDATEIERRAHAAMGLCRLEGEWFSCSVEAAIDAIESAEAGA